LLVTASTIYMSILGPQGLRRTALASYQNTKLLRDRLSAIEGVEVVFMGPVLHEMVLRLPQPVEHVLNALAEDRIQGGYALQQAYPELGNCLLVCATETKTENDLAMYAEKLRMVVNAPLHTQAAFQKKTLVD
jgi:glycine dehydrogenase subunit 1